MATASSKRRGLSLLDIIGTLAALLIGLGAGMVAMRGGWALDPQVAPESTTLDEQIGAAEPNAPTSAPQTHETRTGNRRETIAPVATPATKENAQLQAELAKQLRELRREVALLRSAKGPSTDSSSGNLALNSSASSSNSQREEMGRRTLEFWNQLNKIMEREESMRRVPIGGLTKANAGNFMQRRDKAGRYAVAAFDKMNTASVDPEALEIGQEIRQWYAQGVELNRQGTQLHRSANKQQRQGATGQSWADASKHHNQSVAEINRRGDRLREKLSEKYGLAFPDLR